MSSIFPSKTDVFPTVAAGDAVSANDWNRLVDALLSIQLTLGINPEGTPYSGISVPMTIRDRCRQEFAWDSGIVEATGAVLATGVQVPFTRTMEGISGPVVLCTIQNLGVGESALSGTYHPGAIASGNGEDDSKDYLAGCLAWNIEGSGAGGFLMKGHRLNGADYSGSAGSAVYRVAWIAMSMDTYKADANP